MITKDQYPTLKKHLEREVAQLQQNLANLTEIQQVVEGYKDLSTEQLRKLQQYSAQKRVVNIHL